MAVDTGSLVGSVIGGTYKIRRLLGSGGMGEVYAADGRTGDKVAIKVLHERAAQVDVHPAGEITVQVGDNLVIFVRHGEITAILALNRAE